MNDTYANKVQNSYADYVYVVLILMMGDVSHSQPSQL